MIKIIEPFISKNLFIAKIAWYFNFSFCFDENTVSLCHKQHELLSILLHRSVVCENRVLRRLKLICLVKLFLSASNWGFKFLSKKIIVTIKLYF